jgi:hypothetical protein
MEVSSDTYQNDHQGIGQGSGKRQGLRRMPDILPVSLQDQLHGSKPALRTDQQIALRPSLLI